MDLSQFQPIEYSVSKEALKRATKYIKHRMNGLNKVESAVQSGFSKNSVQTVETTKAYSVALHKILDRSNNITDRLLASLERDAENGLLDELEPDNRASIAKKIAEIQKILTPQITIKEEKDKDGNTKITRWGTGNASSTSQVEHSEEIEDQA